MTDVVDILRDFETVYLQEFTLLLKDIKSILVFFKVVLIVALCLVGFFVLLFLGLLIVWFYMLSQILCR